MVILRIPCALPLRTVLTIAAPLLLIFSSICLSGAADVSLGGHATVPAAYAAPSRGRRVEPRRPPQLPYAAASPGPTPEGGRVECDRRRALGNVASLLVGSVPLQAVLAGKPGPARAANLPKSTGADLSGVGTVEALVPVVRIESALRSAATGLEQIMEGSSSSTPVSTEALDVLTAALKDVPSDEMAFKRAFDSYSDPVSYKQKFMDQNAFLVYYTGGYDGPGRARMEEGDELPRQTLQYGARNDAWAALDDLLVELKFARKAQDGSSTVGDLISPARRAAGAVGSYLLLAPASDVKEARTMMGVR